MRAIGNSVARTLEIWNQLPAWGHWALYTLAFIVGAEGLVLIGVSLWHRFWRSRLGAFVHAWRSVRTEWNSVTVTNLPLDEACVPRGEHTLVYDREGSQNLNPHALAMSGYCRVCGREWRRDPQGLRDGWLPAVRGAFPIGPPLALPITSRRKHEPDPYVDNPLRDDDDEHERASANIEADLLRLGIVFDTMGASPDAAAPSELPSVPESPAPEFGGSPDGFGGGGASGDWS